MTRLTRTMRPTELLDVVRPEPPRPQSGQDPAAAWTQLTTRSGSPEPPAANPTVARTETVRPAFPPLTEHGLLVSEDWAETRTNVRSYVAQNGEGMLLLVIDTLEDEIGSPFSQLIAQHVDPEELAFRQRALAHVRHAATEIALERATFLSLFGPILEVNLRVALELGLQQARAELTRYAVTSEHVTRIEQLGGMTIPVEGTRYDADPWAGELSGLRAAAQELVAEWAHYEQLREGFGEMLAENPFGEMENYGHLVYELKAQWERRRAASIRQYPVLGALSEFEGSKSGLRALAGDESRTKGAAAIAHAVAEVEENYAKVQAQIRMRQLLPGMGLNAWRLDNLVAVTAAQFGVPSNPLWQRFLNDKVEDESGGWLDSKLSLLINLGALLLAPFTAGASLAVLALDAVGLVSDIVDESGKSVHHGTALDPAQRLSAQGPEYGRFVVPAVLIGIGVAGEALRVLRGTGATGEVLGATRKGAKALGASGGALEATASGLSRKTRFGRWVAETRLARWLAARFGRGRVAAAVSEGDTLAAQVRTETGRVGVNVGGTGEEPGFINVNNLSGGQKATGIPNLIEADAKQLGSLFAPGTVDVVVANNIVPGSVDWVVATRGMRRILKDGGTVRLSEFGGGFERGLNIKAALEAAGFRDVEILRGVTVIGVK